MTRFLLIFVPVLIAAYFVVRHSLFGIQYAQISNIEQQIPDAKADTTQKPTLLLNATVHLGNGSEIPNAALGIDSDTISLLGDARVLRIDPSYFDIIELYGTHVYPAQMIDRLKQPAYQPELAQRLATPVSEDSVLVPQLLTPRALQTGSPATLVVVDTLLAENSTPLVMHAFVRGETVALAVDTVVTDDKY